MMSASKGADEAVRELLRFATHAVLFSTNQAAVPAPTINDVAKATACARYFMCRNCQPQDIRLLLGRRRPCLLLVKLLNVALRNAEAAATVGERRSYLGLVCGILGSFNGAMFLFAKQNKHMLTVFQQAARAIVLSGALHCFSRLLARVRLHDKTAEAFRETFKALALLGSVALRLVPYSTFHENFPRELFTALCSSALLEQAAKLIHDAAARYFFDLRQPCEYLLGISNALFGYPAHWPELRDSALPGPFQLYLVTAGVVVALHEYDGGSIYGLMPDGMASARVLLAGATPVYTLPYEGSDLTLLCTWVRMLTPSFGLPRHCPLSARNMYRLCIRSSSAGVKALRALEAWVDSTGGGSGGEGGSDWSGAAAASSRGEQSAVTVASRIRVHRSFHLEVGVGAVISAHDALWEMQQQREEEEEEEEEAAGASGGGARGGAAAWSDAAVWAANGGGGEDLEPSGALESPLDLVRPPDWWKAAVVAMECVLDRADELKHRDTCVSYSTAVLVDYVMGGGLAMHLPDVLPPSPPPDVAAALSAGLIPCLERVIRTGRKPCHAPDVPSLLTAHHLALLTETTSWPHMAWIMAYGNQRHVEALVLTICKVVQPNGKEIALVQRGLQVLRHGLQFVAVAERAQEDGSPGPSSSSGSSSVGGGGAGGMVRSLQGSHGASGSAGNRAMGSENQDPVEKEPVKRLRCMLTMAVEKWLPTWVSSLQALLTIPWPGIDGFARLQVTVTTGEALAVLYILMNEVQQGKQAAQPQQQSQPVQTRSGNRKAAAAAAKLGAQEAVAKRRRFLVHDAELPFFLITIAIGAIQDRLNIHLLAPVLRTVLRQTLVIFCDDMRTVLRCARKLLVPGLGQMTPMKAFMTMLGPDGPIPHKPLLQLVRGVHDKTPRDKMEKLIAAVEYEGPALQARMEDARQKLHDRSSCGNPYCTMVCRSEAILQMPPGGLEILRSMGSMQSDSPVGR